MRLIDADAYLYKGDLENEPTIDAELVRRGKWLVVKDLYAQDDIRCSCCMSEFYNSTTFYDGEYEDICNVWEYCPKCGAKMEDGTNGKGILNKFGLESK